MEALTNLELTTRLLTLEQAFIEAQNRNIDNTYRSEANKASIEQITPYTETKTAYYGEKEKTFYGVPNGNIGVYFDNYTGDYSIKKVVDRVTISFNTLEKKTNITISIT